MENSLVQKKVMMVRSQNHFPCCFSNKYNKERERMTMSMNQLHRIKEMQRKQLGPYQIAKELQVDPKTVKKYMEQEDFSPQAPLKQERGSKLDPFKPLINQWLIADEQNRHKQRHTGKRVYNRLKKLYPDETKFNCSYVTVNRYVRNFRRTRQKAQEGFVELVWHPGEAQADFGECDILENGTRIVCRYLVLTFPYSNTGFVQCFRGETAECLCQGLKDIFNHIGGLPQRIVIDNATGAGRRIGEIVRMTQLFMRFQAHYGFDVTFCNPASGHEKGNVENKVGYARRNYFVPLPTVPSLQNWNQELFELCELDNAREHYKKGTTICELFLEDRKVLSPLPRLPFEACRYERLKTNRCGKFCLDGCHYYSSSPLYVERELVVRIGAHFIEPLDAAGEPISRHIRQFGKERTDTTDWTTMLDQLIAKPGAWRNSIMREQVSYDLRDYLDDQDRSGTRQTLKILRDLSSQYDLDIAIAALQEAITRKRVQGIDVNSAVLAARIASYGLDTPGEPGPDLNGYDTLLPERKVADGTK
jgi:transposase